MDTNQLLTLQFMWLTGKNRDFEKSIHAYIHSKEHDKKRLASSIDINCRILSNIIRDRDKEKNIYSVPIDEEDYKLKTKNIIKDKAISEMSKYLDNNIKKIMIKHMHLYTSFLDEVKRDYIKMKKRNSNIYDYLKYRSDKNKCFHYGQWETESYYHNERDYRCSKCGFSCGKYDIDDVKKESKLRAILFLQTKIREWLKEKKEKKIKPKIFLQRNLQKAMKRKRETTEEICKIDKRRTKQYKVI